MWQAPLALQQHLANLTILCAVNYSQPVTITATGTATSIAKLHFSSKTTAKHPVAVIHLRVPPVIWIKAGVKVGGTVWYTVPLKD